MKPDAETKGRNEMVKIRLDDLYFMVAHIYGEQNALRPVSATLAHFVEVCGMLTIHDRNKKREGIDVEDALCKALGWYFPLLAKLNVRSVEEIVFRKYPLVCPYCRERPHRDIVCKTVRGTQQTVNHEALRAKYDENTGSRPSGLDDWQRMFQEIYPRSMEDKGRSTLGLFEELGELAEAVRVYDRFPKYFAGEAADAFSYIMGIANEHGLRKAQDTGEDFSFEKEFLRRYPGLCTLCGYRVCTCPAIPRATVGRMTKELDIGFGEDLFVASSETIARKGRAAATAVLHLLGGYGKIAEKLPVDRGDANRAFMLLFLRLAAAVEKTQPDLAERLHAAALQVGADVAEAGSPRPKSDAGSLGDALELVRAALRSLDAQAIESLDSNPESLVSELGKSLSKLRVLFVYASPSGPPPVRVANELRAIREAVRLSGVPDRILISDLAAAQVDDLRRALLSAQYEIVHFAGHGGPSGIVLENEVGEPLVVPIGPLAAYLARQEGLKCLFLNSCASIANVAEAIAPFTIGMESAVDDAAAIEFARGFYDALSRGRSVPLAVQEGEAAAHLKGHDKVPVKMLTRGTGPGTGAAVPT